MPLNITENQRQLEHAIDQIRENFLSELGQRVEALDELLFLLEESDTPIPALKGIAEISHKISGVGKTLRLPELGKMAADLETQIAAALSGPVRPLTKSEIVHAVDAMANCMDVLSSAR